MLATSQRKGKPDKTERRLAFCGVCERNDLNHMQGVGNKKCMTATWECCFRSPGSTFRSLISILIAMKKEVLSTLSNRCTRVCVFESLSYISRAVKLNRLLVGILTSWKGWVSKGGNLSPLLIALLAATSSVRGAYIPQLTGSSGLVNQEVQTKYALNIKSRLLC